MDPFYSTQWLVYEVTHWIEYSTSTHTCTRYTIWEYQVYRISAIICPVIVILYHQPPGVSVQTSDVLKDGLWLLLMDVMTLIFNKKNVKISLIGGYVGRVQIFLLSLYKYIEKQSVHVHVCMCMWMRLHKWQQWYPPSLAVTPACTEIETHARFHTERTGQDCITWNLLNSSYLFVWFISDSFSGSSPYKVFPYKGLWTPWLSSSFLEIWYTGIHSTSFFQ